MKTEPYYPPPNHAGILVPPLPNNPVNGDLACAKDVDQLNSSMKNNPNGVRATGDEVGQAIASNAGLSFAAVPPPGAPPAAPALLYDHLFNAFSAELQAVREEVRDEIQAVRGEFAVLLANRVAEPDGPLYDPTRPGQQVFLAAPNPTSRDNLLTFDYLQCINSAMALGLPPLPANADLLTRKRQIAGKIGVMRLMG